MTHQIVTQPTIAEYRRAHVIVRVVQQADGRYAITLLIADGTVAMPVVGTALRNLTETKRRAEQLVNQQRTWFKPVISRDGGKVVVQYAVYGPDGAVAATYSDMNEARRAESKLLREVAQAGRVAA